MGKTTKIFILVSLVVAVGILLWLKENNRDVRSNISGKAKLAVQERSTSLPRLLDIGADKCIPCKMMAPTLEELRKEYAGKLEVVFIDVWKNPSAGKEFGIKLIPTQIFFDGAGQELYRHQGFFSKEDILKQWNKLGFNLNQVTTRTP